MNTVTTPHTVTTPRIKAYSYLRFSTPEQLKGDSFRRQTSMAEAYAAENNLDLDDKLTFHDLGVSGFRGKNVKAGKLAEFLEAVRTGLIPEGSFLLIEALDRLTRLEPWDALDVLREVTREGITVVTLNDRKSYNDASIRANPMDLMLAIMLFIRGNEESATKSRRIKAVWGSKREKATTKPLTPICPAWLILNKDTQSFEAIDDRAELVRRMFAMALDGMGHESIARTFNTEGIPTFGKAKMWHRSYIKRILENPSVIGTFTPHEEEHEGGKVVRKPLAPIAGYFPAIVDEITFQNVQAMRSANGTPKTKGKAPLNNLLSGLTRCPHCGGSMVRTSKGPKSYPYLICSKAKAGAGCVYRAIRQSYVEDALISNIGYIAGTAPSGDNGFDQKLKNVDTGLSATQDMIENILEAIAARPSPALTTKLRELEELLEQLQRERQQLAEQHAAASGPVVEKRLADLTEALTAPELDRSRANALLRQVFNSVTIDWEAGYLHFEWKHGGTDTSVLFALPHSA